MLAYLYNAKVGGDKCLDDVSLDLLAVGRRQRAAHMLRHLT